MLKNSIFTSAIALLLGSSVGLSAEAKSNKVPQLLQQIQQQQQMQQQQKQQGALQPQQGQYDNSNASSGSSGGGDSISMFKAGNTSLPPGTYAMTNVSNGAAFVVIVDDSGDMRAQDARAMNLVDDSKTAKRSSNNRRRGGDSSYSDNNSAYSDGQSGSSQYSNSNQNSSNNSYSSNNPPAMLTPEPTPSSAVLPTPMQSGHPLLQGSSQSSAYPSAQPGGLLPNLFSQQNVQGQGVNGQIPGGMKGALQAELQRQFGKQIMKHGPNIERQVRKVINGIN